MRHSSVYCAAAAAGAGRSRRCLTLLLPLVASLYLSACGQKGPLVLPPPEKEAVDQPQDQRQ